MTVRAIVVGLLCAAVIGGFCFFNDFVIKGTHFVGNFMPISVYGGLILFVLLVNPVLRALGARLRFSGRELAVVLALCLAACYVPGRGLMHYFGTLLMMPHHYAKTNPGWKSEGVIDEAPARMLADPGTLETETRRLDGFVQGLGEGSQHISLGDIPWEAWTRTLSFWLPLIVTISIGMIGLALVVHRQWSEHEHLAYPIATFAHSLLPSEDGAVASVFRQRLFWLGFLPVIVIHLNNYLSLWWPQDMIAVKLTFNFYDLTEIFTTFRTGGGQMLFTRPTIYFTVIGFAYFLSKEVSLSLGIAPFLYWWSVGVFAHYGITISGPFMGQSFDNYIYAGAYFGLFVTLCYTGRHHYWNVARRAFFMSSKEDVSPGEVWGARVFTLSYFLFVAQLEGVGLDWQLGAIYTAILVVLFVGVSRIVAETGAIYLHPYFFPCAMVGGLFGMRALGPEPMIIMFLVSSLLVIDPREAIMPFMVQANRVLSLRQVNPGRTSLFGAAALLVVFVTAVPATLYLQYDRGAKQMGDGWTLNGVPNFGFNQIVKIKQRLEAQDSLELAGSISGWSRFRHASPGWSRLGAFAATMGLVFLFAGARMRFPWWPLHPILFLVLGTWQSRTLGPSFLIGWVIKTIVTKYAGAAGYVRVRPVMIGLIAGELVGGVIPMIIGAIYYYVTGDPPKSYRVLPT